ncbi:uncharacterized protein EI97DRAFT_45128 [Westerdykella ornata]|uniref:C2H2-type domain-containing protein n=1 Tax=Westerdykella ornata TaxID=318751 RepID=A0A6A6JK04_WESOR|nr:uncharacterized protein EI97DRAFT_45128 [Westerdykella ornata]KAF2276594.1 hypothetical protein EI97DRAFT_45128 [Westerdykella ornata]
MASMVHPIAFAMDPNAASGPEQPTTTGKREKRFQCQHCRRMFARLEHLQRHERIHSGIKPFRCQKCNYSFTRSDLLVRHERLTHHKENHQKGKMGQAESHSPKESRTHKRPRTSLDAGRPVSDIPTLLPPLSPADRESPSMSTHRSTNSTGLQRIACPQEFSLATLSMAAEYQSLRGTVTDGAAHHLTLPHSRPADMVATSVVQQAGPMSDADAHQPSLWDSGDGMAALLGTELLSSYQFPSLINTEQPMPFFSPEALSHHSYDVHSPHHDNAPSADTGLNGSAEETSSFSRFGSRLPSLQPEERPQADAMKRRSLADVSLQDRQKLVHKLEEFSAILPADFRLPSRLALCRYIAAYIKGFHEHMPFLHIVTMSIESCHVELILAIAAVGAQYTFEGEKGVELFNASRAIANYRIRRRDAQLVEHYRCAESECSSSHEPDTQSVMRSPPESGFLAGRASEGDDLMQTAQALLLLMALCTWAKHKEILREALAIQSILATLIRDDGLQNEPLQNSLSWADWIRRESIKRTKFIVYGFSNLHCIVYNIPPFILTSEVKLPLPCRAAAFKAATEAEWKEAMKSSPPELQFQEALQKLFSTSGCQVTELNSSAGNYALIHALIQRIFFVRQVAQGRFDGAGDIDPEEIASLEMALRNWQTGWKHNPESSLDPMSPNGPVAFNSTALLRLAYIRLYVDTAGRALETRDPLLIANAFRHGPAIKRSPKITRAVLHSAHALSIPIKIGYRLVAKTQSFIWSIQHSLCTLECGYLLSKWLEALSVPDPEPAVTEDELRIVAIVKDMLDETEFAPHSAIAVGSSCYMRSLSAGVLRVWATIFKGSQTWAIVDVIGSALNIYAQMLESG